VRSSLLFVTLDVLCSRVPADTFPDGNSRQSLKPAALIALLIPLTRYAGEKKMHRSAGSSRVGSREIREKREKEANASRGTVRSFLLELVRA